MNPQTQPLIQTNVQNAVGPGSVPEQGVAPEPVLAGASEYEYVTIYNPLNMTFVGQVGQTRPVNMPFQVRTDGQTATISNSESSVAQNYGLQLKNKDHTGKAHIVNRVTIPAGGTINLLGNEAQVIVRQLVTEILQQSGKKLFLADPTQRHEIEKMIVRDRKSVAEALGAVPQTVESQMRNAVDELNKANEIPFPQLQETQATEAAPIQGSTPRRGRPPKGTPVDQ